MVAGFINEIKAPGRAGHSQPLYDFLLSGTSAQGSHLAELHWLNL